MVGLRIMVMGLKKVRSQNPLTLIFKKVAKTAFWRRQKPYIRSRPKNGSRAMKMNRSGNGSGPGPEMH